MSRQISSKYMWLSSSGPGGSTDWLLRILVVAMFLSLALLVVAPDGHAAPETLAPDGVGAGGSTWTNGTSFTWLQEDPDGATDGNWVTAPSNENSYDGHYTFAAPSGTLTQGAGLQEFRAVFREDASCGSTTASARIEVWDNNTQLLVGTAVNVTALNSCTQGTDCDVLSYTWDAAALQTPGDGSNVEVNLFAIASGGQKANRCSADLGAL